MSVNLKHFVNVNIKQHVSSAVIGTRKTVALFTEEDKQSKAFPIIVNASNYDAECDGMDKTLAYLKVYFDHGGQEVAVYGKETISGLSAEKIMSLPQDYICVAFVNATGGANHSTVLALSRSLDSHNDFYGADRKILLSRITSSEVNVEDNKSSCLATKVSSVVGAEMTIAAYLSKINVYDTDSVHDYMYTAEVIDDEDISDSDYERIIQANMNVDISLAGTVRNCGGNLTDGSDLVNSYVLILLQQTVTSRLTQLLSQKIKSSDGLAKIYAVISQELNNYLSCGYLTTDKIWIDPDLTVAYNNEIYTIVETGTALTDGYLIKVLPFSSLSDSDKFSHKTPPIYLVLASQYGIRAITINGEVI